MNDDGEPMKQLLLLLLCAIYAHKTRKLAKYIDKLVKANNEAWDKIEAEHKDEGRFVEIVVPGDRDNTRYSYMWWVDR